MERSMNDDASMTREACSPSSSASPPPPEEGLRILGVQIANEDATTTETRNRNVEHACAYMRRHRGWDVYVLGEMSTTGYHDDVMEAMSVLTEDARTGPSFLSYSALAKELNAFVVFGFPRLDSDAPPGTRPTISQSVISPDGSLTATYDKLHLCSFGDCKEEKTFRAGDHLTVFEAQRGFRVGVLICYDLRFPDIWGVLARDLNVDVVLHPSAFPDDGSFTSWHTFVKTRAIENQVYVLSLSRAHPHFGESVFVTPRTCVESQTMGRGEGVLPLVVRRDVLLECRGVYSFRTDRRDDYAALSAAACAGND